MATTFDSSKYFDNDEWKTAVDPACSHYDRLGLEFGDRLSPAEINEAFQKRYYWWSEKDKISKSGKAHPTVKIVGPYIPDAIKNLSQAKDILTDQNKKVEYDKRLKEENSNKTEENFKVYVDFTLKDRVLTQDEKKNLLNEADTLGINRAQAEKIIEADMKKVGATYGESRETPVPPTGSGIPNLQIDETIFEILDMKHGSTVSRPFTITNSGSGILSGPIKTDKGWLKVSQSNIDTSQHRQEISFQVDTAGMDYGTKDKGIIEIQSNGGIGRIPVIISLEGDKEAIKRFRSRATWGGLIFGALFGFLLYTYGMNENISNISLIAFVGAVIVASKGGWGSGHDVFDALAGALLAGGLVIFGGTVILYILQFFPHALSTVGWALAHGILAHLSARSIWYARQRGDKKIPIAIGVGGLILTAWIIIVMPHNNYTDNGDGTVTDHKTNLIWQKEDDNKKRDWKKATAYCRNLTLAGYSDWRLPSKNELQTLMNKLGYTFSDTDSIAWRTGALWDRFRNSEIDTRFFPNAHILTEDLYWSSTYKEDRVWGVGNNYSEAWNYKAMSYARCVRGGQ